MRFYIDIDQYRHRHRGNDDDFKLWQSMAVLYVIRTMYSRTFETSKKSITKMCAQHNAISTLKREKIFWSLSRIHTNVSESARYRATRNEQRCFNRQSLFARQTNQLK